MDADRSAQRDGANHIGAGGAGRLKATTTKSAIPGILTIYEGKLDIKCRRNRARRGPRPVRAIAFDRPRHPLPVAWNPSVADIRRPRIDDVGGGVHIPGVAGAGDDGVLALEILRGRILVQSPGLGAGEG